MSGKVSSITGDIESSQVIAEELYFEGLLDQYSAPYRYIARYCRENGSMTLSADHFLSVYIVDIINTAECDGLSARYLSMIEVKTKFDKKGKVTAYELKFIISL